MHWLIAITYTFGVIGAVSSIRHRDPETFALASSVLLAFFLFHVLVINN